MASKVGDRIAPWDRGAGQNALPIETLDLNEVRFQ